MDLTAVPISLSLFVFSIFTMRIRKNAKISALLSSTTNLTSDADESLLKKNLCQLNQSPWDIITFPSSDSSSSLHQVTLIHSPSICSCFSSILWIKSLETRKPHLKSLRIFCLFASVSSFFFSRVYLQNPFSRVLPNHKP